MECRYSGKLGKRWDEEISITETHGPFRNSIPVGVNQAIFLFHALI